MGITAREDVAVGKSEVQDTKDLTFGARTIHFAHKFTGGETSLDLLNLTTPPELLANGFINASPSEIAAAHLSVFKKNLKMALSRGPSGLELKPFAHYVASGNMVNFIGNLRDSGGAQAGEVLFGEIVTVPANSIVVGDVRWIRGTRIIPVGQTLINIGYPYKVGENEDEGQAGMLKLKRNGVAIYRNVGNGPAVAGPETDGNFHEDDSGNGYGTTATLNNAPVGQPDLIEFEVGIQISSGDMGLWGALEAMEGSIIKLADDAAYNFYNDTDITRYIAASPSAIQRRQFGDLVSDARTRIEALEAGHHVLSAFKNGAFSFSANTNETISWDGYDGDRSRGISVSGSSVVFTKKGIYRITINARYNTDVWFKHFMKNFAGTIIGESNWAGGANAPGNYTFMAYVDAPQTCTLLAYASTPGMTISNPAPAGSPQGQVTRTMTLTIEET